jgi:hypothetical protein
MAGYLVSEMVSVGISDRVQNFVLLSGAAMAALL